jgi:hypothetical protein
MSGFISGFAKINPSFAGLSLAPVGTLLSPKLGLTMELTGLKIAQHLPKTSVQLIAPGKEVWRHMDRTHLLTPFEAIAPYSKGGISNNNRASGLSASGKPGHSSLYVGEYEAVRREGWHYLVEKNPRKLPVQMYDVEKFSRWDPRDFAFVQRIGYRFRVTKPIEIVDAEDGNLLDMIQSSIEPSLFKELLRPFNGDLEQALRSKDDHSAMRGLSIGLYKGGMSNISWTSTRATEAEIAEKPDLFNTMALGGKGGDPLEYLAPSALVRFGVDHEGNPVIKYMELDPENPSQADEQLMATIDEHDRGDVD